VPSLLEESAKPSSQKECEQLSIRGLQIPEGPMISETGVIKIGLIVAMNSLPPSVFLR